MVKPTVIIPVVSSCWAPRMSKAEARVHERLKSEWGRLSQDLPAGLKTDFKAFRLWALKLPGIANPGLGAVSGRYTIDLSAETWVRTVKRRSNAVGCPLPPAVVERLRRIHKAMLARCTNANRHNYKDYGAKGITVCPEWKDFADFLADAPKLPGFDPDNFKARSIDRLRSDQGYFAGNCKWSTGLEQSNNRSCNRIFMCEATTEKLTMSQLAGRLNISYRRLVWAVDCGRVPIGWKYLGRRDEIPETDPGKGSEKIV